MNGKEAVGLLIGVRGAPCSDLVAWVPIVENPDRGNIRQWECPSVRCIQDSEPGKRNTLGDCGPSPKTLKPQGYSSVRKVRKRIEPGQVIGVWPLGALVSNKASANSYLLAETRDGG